MRATGESVCSPSGGSTARGAGTTRCRPCAPRAWARHSQAVEYLLSPVARDSSSTTPGLATGGPFPYFPSNGAFLYALALMAAGWDGAPERPAPGFPDDGSWTVRTEGLQRAL